MENEYDDIGSKTCSLVLTKYYHLMKHNVDHTCLKHETEIVQLTNMFRSFEIYNCEYFFIICSITTQSHISSEPAFIAVSSTMNSMIFLFLRYFFVCTFAANSR